MHILSCFNLIFYFWNRLNHLLLTQRLFYSFCCFCPFADQAAQRIISKYHLAFNLDLIYFFIQHSIVLYNRFCNMAFEHFIEFFIRSMLNFLRHFLGCCCVELLLARSSDWYGFLWLGLDQNLSFIRGQLNARNAKLSNFSLQIYNLVELATNRDCRPDEHFFIDA